MDPLNLFYSEPDFDRWVPLDRFPRRLVRRMMRGPRRPGGQERVFLNLVAGLDRLGLPCRINDYRHARRHPEELCCVLGKRQVLDLEPWRNPLMIGPCIHDHPISDPDLFRRRRVRRILVPGPWMREMCRPYWGESVYAWPVGIDTEHWKPDPAGRKDIDFLLYNKIRWDHEHRETTLVSPVRRELARRNLKVIELRYGHYQPEQLRTALRRVRAMIFLCEHETQGIAYQQALAAGVPLLAWDHGGEWLDPSYYPERVRYGPVSSVPYWDDRCGVRFASAGEFPAALDRLQSLQGRGALNPREFILDNLTLEKCATSFAGHAQAAAAGRDLAG
jgi:hypothetical protein